MQKVTEWNTRSDPRDSGVDPLSIEIVRLVNSDISSISESIGSWLPECKNLRVLNLHGNRISRIEGLAGLTSLIELILSGNQISRIEGLTGLTSLTKFELSNNKITRIEGLTGLTSLTKLDLHGNRISRIEGLTGLTSLTELILFGNQITRIEGLTGLTSLTDLNLYGNQITRIEGLTGLTSLIELNLSGNQITRIEGLTGLTSLTTLYLYSNEISQIEGLTGLTSLTKLYLQNNEISRIEELTGLTSLSQMDLTDNHISRIEGLTGLTSLTRLYLSINRISWIEGLTGLTSLAVLILYRNQITFVPNVLVYCPRLQHLVVDSNPVERYHPIIEAFLQRNVHVANREKLSVYSDSQSVHSVNVQASIRKNLITLLETDDLTPFTRVESVIESILADADLPEATKKSLVEYSADVTNEVTALPGVKFVDVLLPVWNRISKLPLETTTEVKRVLSVEMADAECMCFTGRVSRLVNCLTGFSDDITVEISKPEQIANIVFLAKQKLISTGEFTREAHVRLVTEEMIDREYTPEEIEVWTAAIIE